MAMNRILNTANSHIYYKLITLTAILFLISCNREKHPTIKKQAHCKGEIKWPDKSRLFSRFAKDKQFMNRFLYNGDDLFPKTINLCARGRNSLLDLAHGPETSNSLGLWGSAWESHVRSVAFTHEFKSLYLAPDEYPWLAVWPVVTTGFIYRLRLLNKLILKKKVNELPVEITIPREIKKSIKEYWPTSDQKDVNKKWIRRLRGAYFYRLLMSANSLKIKFAGFNLGIKVDIDRFLKYINPLTTIRQNKIIEKFIVKVRNSASQKGVLFPSRELKKRLTDMVMTKVEGYKRPLSLFQLTAYNKSLKKQVWNERIKTINFILGLQKVENPSEKLILLRNNYLNLKKEGNNWMKILGDVAKRPELKAKIYKMLNTEPMIATGNFFFGTSHLEESTTGYTHVGLVINLGTPHKPWLFDRVLGFYYANPVKDLKNSAVVELLRISPYLKKHTGRFAIIPFKVTPPFRFKRGFSDFISWLNIYTHLKGVLPSQYALGPGFIFGAIHLITHTKTNEKLLNPLYKASKLGDYSYLQFKSLKSLKGKTIDVIVRCK